MTLALMSTTFAIVQAPSNGWTSPVTLALVAGEALLLLAFWQLQRRLTNPIMPLRILRVGGLTSSSAVRGLAAMGMFACFFLGSLYLNRILNFGPVQTGLAFLPMTLTVAFLSLGTTARLSERFGPRVCTSFGLVFIVASLVLLSGADEQTAYFPRLFLAFGLLGLGAGMSFMPLLTIALAEVPNEDAGLASGIVNVSMQLSAALGLAVLGSISSQRTADLVGSGMPLNAALIDGFHVSFAIAAACVGLGLLAALVLLRSPALVRNEDSADAELPIEDEVWQIDRAA